MDLYMAKAHIDINNGIVELTYKNIELDTIKGDTLYTKENCLTSKHSWTKVVFQSMLNREYNISETETVIYTGSENTCEEWLEAKRKCVENVIKKQLHIIEDAEIIKLLE